MNYLSAEQVIPVITPHLKKETGLSAKGFQLIIQSTPEEYKKIQQLLTLLDKKPAQYLAEVRIINRKLDDKELKQTQLTINQHSTDIKIKRYRTQDNKGGDRRFTLRITENNQGFVNTGESFPTHRLVQHYNSFIPKTIHKEVTSGFYIKISQLPEDKVRIAINAQSQSRKLDQSIKQSSTDSLIVGKKDSWILLASTGNNDSSNGKNKYSTRNNHSNKQWYYLRVNELAN